MKSIFKILPICLLAFMLTGCFDIIEDISMNKDGSGNATFKVDMSQSKQELANYLNMGKVNDVKIPTKTEISAQMDKLKAAFEGEAGISQVSLQKDFEEFIFTFKCHFTDLNTFNAAVNKATKKMARFPVAIPKMNHFSASKGRFVRHFDYPMDGIKKYEDLSFTERFLLESATFTSIHRFPNPVRSQSNAKAELSGSKKAVKIETPLSGFVKGEVSLENEIAY